MRRAAPLAQHVHQHRVERVQRGIDAGDVAYVGNDLNDLECMGHVGLPIAVSDAYPQVLRVARLVTTRPGGHGAVREVCDWILVARR
jgi:N-acylneuraminate cytidylyltransferase